MKKNNLTPMQRQMIDACGHEVEVHLIDSSKCITGAGRPMVGRCTGYTSPLDNEPEIASIDLRVPGWSCIFEIYEYKIEKIVIKD